MKTCKACGAPIVWIKTPKGKAMPCDAQPVYYEAEPHGTKRIVKQNGEVIACEYAVDPAEATGTGYIPHWATCPAANEFRERREKWK